VWGNKVLSKPNERLIILQDYSLLVVVVAKLKCSKCGKAFDKKAVADYGAAGVTGARVGVGYDLLV